MIIPAKEVSGGVGELGLQLGVAPLPVIGPDRCYINVIEAEKARIMKMAIGAAKQLRETCLAIEDLGGEIELPGKQATETLHELEKAMKAAKTLISKIKNGGLCLAARGGAV